MGNGARSESIVFLVSFISQILLILCQGCILYEYTYEIQESIPVNIAENYLPREVPDGFISDDTCSQDTHEIVESSNTIETTFADSPASLSGQQNPKRVKKGHNCIEINTDSNDDDNSNSMDIIDDRTIESTNNEVFEKNREYSNEKLLISNVKSITKKSFYVTYLGFPEKNDEWLPKSSDRISRFNSQSFQQRGENPIREEVLFMIKPILSLEESTSFVVLRDSCFLSPNYAKVVSVFCGINGFDDSGFEKILLFLQKTSSVDPKSYMNSVRDTILQSFSLAIAFGNTNQVLSQLAYSTYGLSFVNFVLRLITEMSLVEIRSIPVEMIESVLKSVEIISFRLFGILKADNNLFEKVWLDISIRSILCPFLNRRLGGLRLLTELIRRGINTVSYPSGIKISVSIKTNDSKSNASSVNTSTGSSAPVSHSDEVIDLDKSLSFKVVPILYNISLDYICSRIQQEYILENIFQDNSHSSLIERIGEVLKSLSLSSNFSIEYVNMIWKSAFIGKEITSWKVLIEFVSYCDVSAYDYLLKIIDSSIVNDFSPVTNDIIDLLVNMSIRLKQYLIRGLDVDFYRLNTFQVKMSGLNFNYSENQSNIVDNASSYHIERNVIDCLLNYNISILDCMWDFIQDDSGVTNSVVSYCLDQFQKIFSTSKQSESSLTTIMLTKNTNTQNDFMNISWDIHWHSSRLLIQKSISSLEKGVSIIPSIRVVQAYMHSWPSFLDVNLDTKCSNKYSLLPFQMPYKSSLVGYLQDSWGVISLLRNAIVRLKSRFDSVVDEYNQSQSIHPVAASHTEMDGNVDIPKYLSCQIIDKSRVNYKDNLNKLFDFLSVFIKNCENISISYDLIESLWEHIVIDAKTAVEVEYMVSFIRRLTSSTTARIGSRIDKKRFGRKDNGENLAQFEDELETKITRPAVIDLTGLADSDEPTMKDEINEVQIDSSDVVENNGQI